MREYLEHSLGGLDHPRLAREGMANLFFAAAQVHKSNDELRAVAEEYLPHLDVPVREFYEFALGVALTGKSWVMVPRIAGGEEHWWEVAPKAEHRYAIPAKAAARMLRRLGFTASGLSGLLCWGVDDEDRLPKLGSMPMYLVAGDGYADGEVIPGVLDKFAEVARGLGYEISQGQKQHMIVNVAQGFFTSDMTDVFRLTYSGPRKRGGGKLKGGYVGGTESR
jgi:hypothetical protein